MLIMAIVISIIGIATQIYNLTTGEDSWHLVQKWFFEWIFIMPPLPGVPNSFFSCP
jgi:hypothetical protein